MAVLTRMSASLLPLAVVAGCGTEEATSPAGTWTTTITATDDPPSDRLIDSYRLELGADGRYVLEGAGFTANGVYVVDGDALELRDDDRCATGTVGRYDWRTGDDGALSFTARTTDPCDRPLGGREFVLTRHAWSPAAG
jgi:hypothetical protein